MRNKRIYFFIGTTAELIKLALVINRLKDQRIDFKIITSGQNRILFKELEEYLGPSKVHIAFGEKDEISSVFHFALWAIKTFFRGLFYLRKEFRGLDKNNSYFLVHGDTVSSLIGALVASIYRLKVVHIEAGLRSFNFLEPFPEELCRFIISYLADIHFCPNEWCINNLKNLDKVKVNTYQNTLIESFWTAIRKGKHLKLIKKIKKKYFVLVIHRQEHVMFGKKQTKKILEFILKHANKDPSCIFIIHELTKKFLESAKIRLNSQIKKNIVLVPRLPYVNFIKLINNAEYLITDGGSNQEEAYYMGKPCLLLRNCTERIEGLGENVVLSKGNKDIIKDFLKNYQKYKRGGICFKEAPSKIIVDYLLKH